MIWYSHVNNSSLTQRSKEGLLIRGVDESLIFSFELDSNDRIKACEKAVKIIKKVKNNYGKFKHSPKN
jgi:hypothetical protein